MPPKKDPTLIYIEGPKMDWAMDDGLYTCFQDWKLECELILDGALAEIVEPHKVNTLIWWAGSFELKNLKVWQKDKTKLTLAFIWKEYDTYCKPHSNDLWAQYKLFKQLCQGTTPCDNWYTTVQNQLTMCNYKADMGFVLQCNIFLFGLNDQAFISKIISEESPDVTAATIRQKLKKLKASRATAKYIKGNNATGKDSDAEGVIQVQKQGNPKAKVHKRKGWHKDSQSHPAKKPFKPNPWQGQLHRQGQKPQKPKAQQSVGLYMCKIVNTQDTDQDLTVLHPSTNERSARTMVTSPASASQRHRTQMWTLLKRWILYLHLVSHQIVCSLNSHIMIALMWCTYVQ